MSGVRDSVLDLEKHRQLLEQNIHQLQKALQHWRIWDAEYEALKEEVEAAPSTGQAAELRRIQLSFDGALVDRKEIDDVFGREKLKTRDQIVNVLERRVDYVTRNIESLTKQLETAEDKYAAAAVISQPDDTGEDGQPITDVVEELDEEDNVLSYRLNTPGESLPHVREALEKAGVDDLPTEDESKESLGSLPLAGGPSIGTPDVGSQPRQSPSRVEAGPKNAVPFSETKKVVSFSEDTKPESEPQQLSKTAKRVEQIMESAKEQEAVSSQSPVIPDDEDPEDAALRQQMLMYGMGEVGAVVAELQMEEMGPDEDADMDLDYSDVDEEEDDNYDDKYGRSTSRMVTDDYRQRMLELEQKLGIQSRFTKESNMADDGAASGSEDERLGRIVVNRKPEPSSTATKAIPSKSSIKAESATTGVGKKGVRFASSLDIAPDEDPAVSDVNDKEHVVDPLSDIVERSAPPKVVEAKSTQKPSRFRRNREEAGSSGTIPKGPFDAPMEFLDDAARPMPKGPDGATIADQLVERDVVSDAPHAGDFGDDATDLPEVASEHQRMRRKFIQREGGFLKEDESPVQPLDESEGGPERMSRFKAARLSRQ